MKRNHFVIVGLFAASLAYSGGREVVVAVRWQANVHGELIMVQDTSLVVAATLEGQESGNAIAESSMVIPFRSIEYVKVTGRNLVGQAAGYGALAGIVFAGPYSAIIDERHPGHIGYGLGTITGVVGGIMIGLTVGAGIGYLLSSEEMYLDPADPSFREILQQAAAHPLSVSNTQNGSLYGGHVNSSVSRSCSRSHAFGQVGDGCRPGSPSARNAPGASEPRRGKGLYG